MFNKNLFKARMIEAGVTVEKLADMLGVNSVTLYRKINGTSDFTRAEVQLLRQMLSLSPADADAIFFAS